MMETDNRVVFERNVQKDTWGYIEHIESGERVDITRKGNALIMQLWVPRVTEVYNPVTDIGVIEVEVVQEPAFARLEEDLI